MTGGDNWQREHARGRSQHKRGSQKGESSLGAPEIAAEAGLSETLMRPHPARSAARRLSGLGARSHLWHRPPTPLPGLPAAPALQSADFLTFPCP